MRTLSKVRRGTPKPLRLARVVLMDFEGAYVWSGTLSRYFRDNRTDAAERADIVKMLRPQEDTGLSEPCYVGGGANPGFALMLIEPPLYAEDLAPIVKQARCSHGQWVGVCLQCNPPAEVVRDQVRALLNFAGAPLDLDLSDGDTVTITREMRLWA